MFIFMLTTYKQLENLSCSTRISQLIIMNRIFSRHLGQFQEFCFSLCTFRTSCTYVGWHLGKVTVLAVAHVSRSVLSLLSELLSHPNDYISVCIARNLAKQFFL